MESDLTKVASAALLKSFSVVGNFLEILQRFKENSFQYKKYIWLIVSQAYKSRRYVCMCVCVCGGGAGGERGEGGGFILRGKLLGE